MKTTKPDSTSEFNRFDGLMRTILSVSHKELQEREKKYKRTRAKKKRAKS
jgi:hypothetical protein